MTLPAPSESDGMFIAVEKYDRLREAARQIISIFMADATLDDPDGRWDAAINELEAAAGLTQQGGS